MKTTLSLVIFTIFSISCYAQNWDEEPTENEDRSIFFAGINAGAFFANNNTALIYNGSSSVTPFGINYILTNPNYKPTIDLYFQYPYSIVELPLNPTYKVTMDIGLHAGVNLGGGSTVYIDINSSKLSHTNVFTVAIDDPYNQSPEPTFEQIPIIGKEKRVNINLGTQLSFYNKNKITAYCSFFGNFNKISLEENYIMIGSQKYDIYHNDPLTRNFKPTGLGYGGGAGTGLKYKLSDKIKIDLTYNFYYIKTKISDDIHGFGINNGALLRLIWN